MKKVTYTIKQSYIFDPAHTGAPYSLNGGRNWTNGGELKEVLLKGCLNFEVVKDANGRFDRTDDIPQLNASVKSSKATLVNMKLGQDFESFKRNYFANVHSTLFIWVSIHDEELTAYFMNATEFESFMDRFATFTKERQVIRFKAESLKMLQWLDERAN